MARAKTKKPKTRKPKYEPLLKLPPLSPEEYEGLRSSIAVSGVLVPILVDSDGPKRRIVDGNHRRQIAVELGYDCPETVISDLPEEELRSLSRALNLARRQLNTTQKREIIAQQLRETPQHTNRLIAKMLGVSHPTVASVPADLVSVGKVYQQERRVGSDGKSYKASKPRTEPLPPDFNDGKARLAATTLLHGDCRDMLKSIRSGSIDTIIADPIYPEVKRKDYPRVNEADWHALMREVVKQCRRVLKPKGSVVFILQPNAEKYGRMRPWLFEFMAWTAREWNLVQDAWWWAIDAMPVRGTERTVGLLRPSVKACVWLGPPDCYRNQENVLWTPSDSALARRRSDNALRGGPSGRTYRNGKIGDALDERGGSTPFILLPMGTGGGDITDAGDHPTATPYRVVDWWCRYLLPSGGVLLDPFVGSGTTLVAGLNNGASKVIGIDREAKFLKTARRRIAKG